MSGHAFPPPPRIDREGDPEPPVAPTTTRAAPLFALGLEPDIRPEPRIEQELSAAPRLSIRAEEPAETALAGTALAEPGWGMPVLVLSGFGVLSLGLAALQTGNFVAAQFARSAVLGSLTLAVALLGFGLMLLGLWREARALWRLRSVDRLRLHLAGSDPVAKVAAARQWLGMVRGGAGLRPALDALNDPDAVLPLLRAGLEAPLKREADALGRRAAMGVVAGMAATPAPSLVVLLVSWRGLRLIRQVASLYGLRPGLLGTLGLLRRTAGAATATAVTEVAINSAAHAILSTPLLSHLAGEMAGGAVAARRMVVLGRAAAVACTPLPQE